MFCHHVPSANIFCSPIPFAKHFFIIPSAWFIPWLTKSARVVLICNMNTLRNFFSFGVVRNLQHKNTAWWTNCLKLVSGLDNFILRDAWPHFPKQLQHIESCAPQGSWGCKNLNQSSFLFLGAFRTKKKKFRQLTSEIIIRPHFFHQLSCIWSHDEKREEMKWCLKRHKCRFLCWRSINVVPLLFLSFCPHHADRGTAQVCWSSSTSWWCRAWSPTLSPPSRR